MLLLKKYFAEPKIKRKKSKKFFFLFLTFRLSGEKISHFEQLKLSYNKTRDNFQKNEELFII